MHRLHSLPAGAIAGIVVGVLLLLALAVTGTYFRRRRRLQVGRAATFDRDTLDGATAGVPPDALRTSPFTSEINVGDTLLAQPPSTIYETSRGSQSSGACSLIPANYLPNSNHDCQ